MSDNIFDGPRFSRRGFLEGLGGLALLSGTVGVSGLLSSCDESARGQVNSCGSIGPVSGADRKEAAYQLRVDLAKIEKDSPLVAHSCNGDEALYENKIANYSKGLPHNDLGEVDVAEYDKLIHALETGSPADFEQVTMQGDIKLKNPQAGLSFDLIGADSNNLYTPPPPEFAGAETAAEMAELYWMALARDVHFSDYESSDIINAAVEDLSNFPGYAGPAEITPQTIFRVDIPGINEGPFLSQFLLKDIPAGPQISEHKIRTLLPVDYMTGYDEWLQAQNGIISQDALSGAIYDPVPRLIRNGRDLAENQHWDWPAQEAVNAMLIIFALEGRSPAEVFLANLGVPYDGGNPYNSSESQAGFVTFHIVDSVRLIVEAMNSALKASWFQKWYVHRRLRPETFGGRIHNNLTGATSYPIHEDLLGSTALDAVSDIYGSYLLPQAFPEGAPCHPAYTSGHATWAGATATVLKAFFDEDAVVPTPVTSSADGLGLVPYEGDPMTIGGELNKLAWNVAMGRNFGGIHWRTDAIEGLYLGETVAITLLTHLRTLYSEPFGGFTFTTFSGDTVTV